MWRGTQVAIKTMLVPAGACNTQKSECMAVMEAAISSSLSHPNVVQTFTYSVTPVIATGINDCHGASHGR